jgi:hypothetical protein
MKEKNNLNRGNLPEKHDPDAHAPTLRMPAPDQAGRNHQEVDKTRKSTGRGVLAALGLSMAASGAIGTFGYMYVTEQFPFAPKPTSGAVTGGLPNSSANVKDAAPVMPETPETIQSNQDLKMALQIHKIRASARDFEFGPDHPGIQAKAVILIPKESPEGAPDARAEFRYSWQPVKDRITRTDQKEMLVALKFLNTNIIAADAHKLIVPEGLSYRARTVDATDPAIMYFYYNCQDKKGEQALLAQIGIKDPIHPKKLMWAKSFMLPTCE